MGGDGRGRRLPRRVCVGRDGGQEARKREGKGAGEEGRLRALNRGRGVLRVRVRVEREAKCTIGMMGLGESVARVVDDREARKGKAGEGCIGLFNRGREGREGVHGEGVGLWGVPGVGWGVSLYAQKLFCIHKKVDFVFD